MAKAQKTSGLPLKAPTKLVQNRIAIIGLSVFVAIIAAFGIYKVGFSHASNSMQTIWRSAMAFSSCPTNAYGVPATLSLGSTGGCVAAAQRMLNTWMIPQSVERGGYYNNIQTGDIHPPPTNTIVQDGIYGQSTKNLVIQFQKNRGLTPDGVVGPTTWAQLYNCWTPSMHRPGDMGFWCRADTPDPKG